MEYYDLLIMLADADIINVRNKQTKELLAVQLVPSYDLYHTDIRSLVSDGKQRDYLMSEFAWYLNGNRDVTDISKRSKFWNKLTDDDGNVNSNYGYLTMYERCHKVKNKWLSPAEWCVHAFKKDIHTRQAVMLYNKPKYVTDTKDFICTQTQQFICRGNTLHNIVNIRSSDAIRGLSFDIPWWRFIGNVIANTLKLGTGYMVINIGSAHIYEPHFRLVNNMLYNDWVKYTLRTRLTLADIYRKKKWTVDDVKSKLIIESYDDSDIRGGCNE